jgi:tetratricopeptide (TPR) repeat protein
MSKQMFVTLPVLLLLLDYWPLGRWASSPGGGRFTHRTARQLLLEKVPILAVAITFSLIVFFVQRAGGAVQDTVIAPIKWRLLNAVLSYGKYIYLTIWPSGLSAYYPHPLHRISMPAVLASAAFLLVVSLASVRFRKTLPYLFVGWWWYVVSLMPVIGVIQVGSQAMADRYTYVPHIGLLVALTWSARELAERLRWPKWAFPSAFLLAVGALLIVASLQVRYWELPKSIWERSLAVSPNNYPAQVGLAWFLRIEGKNEEAQHHLLQALKLVPNGVDALLGYGVCLRDTGKNEEAIKCFNYVLSMEPDEFRAHSQLGLSLIERGEYDAAIDHLRRALAKMPKYDLTYAGLALAHFRKGEFDEGRQFVRQGLAINPDNPGLYSPLADAYLERGEKSRAMRCYFEALKRDPRDSKANNNLGVLLVDKGELAAARDRFSDAIRIKPDYAEARNNLARVLVKLGNVNEGLEQYRAAARYRPTWPEPWNNLAWVRATHPNAQFRDGREAVLAANKAADLTGRSIPAVLDTLAAAYAEAGSFDEAVKAAESAVEKASAAGEEELAREIQTHVALYRSQQPYRERESRTAP